MSVCLCVRSKLVSTFTNLPQILFKGLGKTTKMFLAWFERFKLIGLPR